MIAMTQVLVPLLLLLLHAQLPPVSSVRRLVAEFQHGSGHNLSHLALDTSRGRIYVAGTNVLYQLVCLYTYRTTSILLLKIMFTEYIS